MSSTPPQHHQANSGKVRVPLNNFEVNAPQPNHGQARAYFQSTLFGLGTHLDANYDDFLEHDGSMFQDLDDITPSPAAPYQRTWTQPSSSIIAANNQWCIITDTASPPHRIQNNLANPLDTLWSCYNATQASHAQRPFITPSCLCHQPIHVDYNNTSLNNNLDNHEELYDLSSDRATYAYSTASSPGQAFPPGYKDSENAVDDQHNSSESEHKAKHEAPLATEGNEGNCVACGCESRVGNVVNFECLCYRAVAADEKP